MLYCGLLIFTMFTVVDNSNNCSETVRFHCLTNSTEKVDKECLIDAFIEQYPVDEWCAHGFTLDFLRTINPHWLRFAPQPHVQHHVLAGCYVCIMSIGVMGNLLVIFVFLRNKSLRTPANFLVVNLACSDLLMMLKMPIFIYNSLHYGPALGELACRLYGFIGGLCGTCSICTITAISLDRYYVIRYPLCRSFSSLRAKCCICGAWCYALLFAGIPLLDIGYGRYTPEGYLTACSFDYLSPNPAVHQFIWVFFVGAFVAPLTVILYCYAAIVLIVVRSASQLEALHSRHIRVEEQRKQELRVTATVCGVTALWCAAWTPYAIVALLGILGGSEWITPLASMIPALICKSAACCDPFVYALTHPKFKQALVSRNRRRFTQRCTNYSEYDGCCATVTNTLAASSSKNCKTTIKKKTYWWYRPRFDDKPTSWRRLSRNFPRQHDDAPVQDNQAVEEFTLQDVRQ